MDKYAVINPRGTMADVGTVGKVVIFDQSILEGHDVFLLEFKCGRRAAFYGKQVEPTSAPLSPMIEGRPKKAGQLAEIANTQEPKPALTERQIKNGAL